MVSLRLVLLILALVSFFGAAVELQVPRINLTATGLFFATLAMLVT